MKKGTPEQNKLATALPRRQIKRRGGGGGTFSSGRRVLLIRSQAIWPAPLPENARGERSVGKKDASDSAQKGAQICVAVLRTRFLLHFFRSLTAPLNDDIFRCWGAGAEWTFFSGRQFPSPLPRRVGGNATGGNARRRRRDRTRGKRRRIEIPRCDIEKQLFFVSLRTYTKFFALK